MRTKSPTNEENCCNRRERKITDNERKSHWFRQILTLGSTWFQAKYYLKSQDDMKWKVLSHPEGSVQVLHKRLSGGRGVRPQLLMLLTDLGGWGGP